MGLIELIIIAVGVSMDAFAVSVCKGLSCPCKTRKTALLCGIWFGLFQMIMPLIGYLIGSVFAGMIERFDHWIAFALLLFIGGKMIIEALSKEKLPLEADENEEDKNDLSISKMLLLAIATSIDALAVGVTFAMVETNIVVALSLIGICTFSLSFIGALIGKHFGEKHRKVANFIGGLVLVLIGAKILIEHLFF
jgi:putative Mn2+ efflux pump MntP